MNILRSLSRGVIGFFVDDGAFAAAALVLIAAIWISMAQGLMPPRLGALLLPVFLAIMLALSVRRMVKARLRRRS